MSDSALSGVNVLDLSDGVSGGYCTKIMADLGAQVIKVEPPVTGDSARSAGPFLNDVPNIETSAPYLYLNAGKKSITLDLKSDAAKPIVQELVRQTDILIENFKPGVMAELGLDYASLLDAEEPGQGLRRTVVPHGGEFLRMPGELDDPLAEDEHSPVPGLVHRYPDRALLMATHTCATYCRYCTRSRLVGAAGGDRSMSRSRLEAAIDHIAATPSIRDVLLSGGDPLTLGDERLNWILERLHRIPHVEFIRIGTKVPVVMPQRIGTSDVKALVTRPGEPWKHDRHCRRVRSCHPIEVARVLQNRQSGLQSSSFLRELG
ncbi:MAG: CoA transferase [Chloroflexi bacterium]|nr:CoA transferase [Chloroflexota bacterium]